MGGAAEGDGNMSGGANASGAAEGAGERPGGCSGLGAEGQAGRYPRCRAAPRTAGHEHRGPNDSTRHLCIHKLCLVPGWPPASASGVRASDYRPLPHS